MKAHFSPQLIFDITSIQALSPLQLHAFLQLLIRYEQAPGGPYRFPVSESQVFKLNQHIAALFKQVGKPLPNVEEYLAHTPIPKQPIYTPSSPQTPGIPHSRMKLLRRIIGPEAYAVITPLVGKLGIVNNSGELTRLSATLADALTQTGTPSSLTPHSLNLLGEANFLVWIAYSLYDQFLDDSPSPQLLPIANQVLRYASHVYLEAGVPLERLNEALDSVDQANEYEVRMCRAPVKNGYIVLSSFVPSNELIHLQTERSFVHCLGPLFVLEHTPLSATASAAKMFKEYCAVRQFNDDIHDWQEDLANGHITYPVHWLLQKYGVVSGTHKINELIPALQALFWQEGLDELVSECLERALKVRAGYKKAFHLPQESSFNAITITPIINACHQALKKHSFEKSFLAIAQLHRSTYRANQ